MRKAKEIPVESTNLVKKDDELDNNFRGDPAFRIMT